MFSRRTFSTSIDTYKLVNNLKRNGLSDEKVAAISDCFLKLLTQSIGQVKSLGISKDEFQKNIFQHKIELTQAESDVQTQLRNDYSQSKMAHDSLFREFIQNIQKSKESLSSLKSESRLEISLEKGRIRDSFLAQFLKFQDLHSKIDTEGSNGNATIGKLRHEIFYSLTGFFFTSVAALLGYLRYYGE